MSPPPCRRRPRGPASPSSVLPSSSRSPPPHPTDTCSLPPPGSRPPIDRPRDPSVPNPASELSYSAPRAASAGVVGDSPGVVGASPSSFPDGGQPEMALVIIHLAVNLVYEVQIGHLAAQQPPLPSPAKTQQSDYEKIKLELIQYSIEHVHFIEHGEVAADLVLLTARELRRPGACGRRRGGWSRRCAAAGRWSCVAWRRLVLLASRSGGGQLVAGGRGRAASAAARRQYPTVTATGDAWATDRARSDLFVTIFDEVLFANKTVYYARDILFRTEGVSQSNPSGLFSNFVVPFKVYIHILP